MMEVRSVEDRLRAEYFNLLPDMQRTQVALDAEIRHRLLPVMIALDRYEQVHVVSRLKGCESAVDALRRRQEPRDFAEERADTYSLSTLRDLVGFRILVFPSSRIARIHSELSPLLEDWTADPVPASDTTDPPIALKFFGHSARAGSRIMAEVQIVSSLIGSFWDVEHAAVYKTSPKLQGVMASLSMKSRYQAVLAALRDFENEFECLIQEQPRF